MKVQGEIEINVSGGLQVGMLAQWDGKTWKAATKRSALSDVYADLNAKDVEIASLKAEIEVLKSHINTLAKAIGGNEND
jgi:capsule polysaccharide export protein KpsE/RkpR